MRAPSPPNSARHRYSAQRRSRRASAIKNLTRALSIDGRVLCDQIVDAGGPLVAQIMSGNHLRIIDLEGQQAVDFLCYDLANTENRYNAGNTLKFNGSIFIGKGVKLYSDSAESLMTVTEDTVGFTTRSAAAAATKAIIAAMASRDAELPRQLHCGAGGAWSWPTRHPRERELLHVRAGKTGWIDRDRRGQVGAGRLCRSARGQGRSGGHVELSPTLQSLQRLESDTGASDEWRRRRERANDWDRLTQLTVQN
jgi:hypothetical protein